jgi:hypothetical protein
MFHILVGHSQSMCSNVHSFTESQSLCTVRINGHHTLAILQIACNYGLTNTGKRI